MPFQVVLSSNFQTSATTSRVLTHVAASLGAEYKSPYQDAADVVLKQWETYGSKFPNLQRPAGLDSYFKRLVVSGEHGVSVRYRMSDSEKKKEDEEYRKASRYAFFGDSSYDSD